MARCASDRERWSASTRRRVARRAPCRAAAGRASGRVHRRVVLSRRLRAEGLARQSQRRRRCRSRWMAAASCWSTTCSAYGPLGPRGDQRALRLRPSGADRARGADRSRRPRGCRSKRRYVGARARRGARACRIVLSRIATATSSCRSNRRRAHRVRRHNPQLNADGELHASADARRPAGRDHQTHSRYRRAVRVDRRARREEGAAAARQGGVQPVLSRTATRTRTTFEDRRQAPVGRRHQPQHRRLARRARARRCSTPSTTWWR